MSANRKVTALITRPGRDGPELLVFEHPVTGLQLPAGTVEEGESFAAAALREGWEETGALGLELVRELAVLDVRGEERHVFPSPRHRRDDRPLAGDDTRRRTDWCGGARGCRSTTPRAALHTLDGTWQLEWLDAARPALDESAATDPPVRARTTAPARVRGPRRVGGVLGVPVLRLPVRGDLRRHDRSRRVRALARGLRHSTTVMCCWCSTTPICGASRAAAGKRASRRRRRSCREVWEEGACTRRRVALPHRNADRPPRRARWRRGRRAPRALLGADRGGAVGRRLRDDGAEPAPATETLAAYGIPDAPAAAAARAARIDPRLRDALEASTPEARPDEH